jgi:hypothetical protein
MHMCVYMYVYMYMYVTNNNIHASFYFSFREMWIVTVKMDLFPPPMSMEHLELKFCPTGKDIFYLLPSIQTGFKAHLASY